jgi:ribosomal-protein-alanine N-acetyltransferase
LNTITVYQTTDTIDGSGVRLRPFQDRDAESLCRIINEDQVRQAMVTITYPFSEADAMKFIEESNTSHQKRFAVLQQGKNDLLGCVSLLEIDRTHLQAELSFFMSERASGKGLMTEAGKILIKYAFTSLALNRIYAFHLVDNIGSAKVLEKLGLIPEGTLRERVKKNGQFYDVRLLSLLKREFDQVIK